MGEVFRAHRSDGLPGSVAVKLLRGELVADADLVSRFLQESRLLRGVEHPNVVRVLDLVAEGDRFAIVMDYVPDGDLRQAVPVPAPFRLVVDLLAQVADGLAAIHAAGITHRDLKPENVLVERAADGTLRARVSDFGVSHRSDSVSARDDGIVGTADYLAPESALGRRPGPPGDVYSLGVMLYEMSCGYRPFTAESIPALIRAHVDHAVPRPPAMTEPVWALVSALLAKDPRTRPTAAETAGALRRLRPPEGILLAAPSAGGPPSTGPRVTGPRVTGSRVTGSRAAMAPGAGDCLPASSGARVPAARLPGPDTLLPASADRPHPVRTSPVTGGSQDGSPAAGTGPPDLPGEDARPAPPRVFGVPRRRTALLAVLPLAVLVIAADVVTGSGSVPRTSGPDPAVTVMAPPATPSAAGSGPSVAAASEPPVRTGPPGHDRAAIGGGGTRTVAVTTTVAVPVTPTGPALPAPAVPQLSLYQPGGPPEESDGEARLEIAGVDPGTGTLTSVMVVWAGGGRSLTPVDGYGGPYLVTVDGLRNGRPYAFAARICNSYGGCSTSAPVTFTPYALPTLGELSGSASATTVTVTWPALQRQGDPGTWTCRLSVLSSSDDDAPDGRPVPPTGGQIRWHAVPGSLYQAQESCTDGVTTVSARSPLFQAP